MGKKSFIIKLASGSLTQCSASFFRIEQGCLWFRNMVADGSTNAFETVIVYAPGEWRTVEEGQ